MRIRTITIATLAAALAGCSQGSGMGSSGSTAYGSTAGAITSGMPAPTRPAFYVQSVYLSPASVPGGTITAMGTASVGTAVLVADAPFSAIRAVDNGAETIEGQLYFDATSFATDSAGATFAASGNREAPGAGDLWARVTGGWQVVIDSRDNEMVVGAVGDTIYAAHGSLEGRTTVRSRPAGGSFAEVATIESAVPTAIAGFAGEAWIGVTGHDPRGGAAKLMRGTTSFKELPLPIKRVSGSTRQEITAMTTISFVATNTTTTVEALAVAVAEYDASGRSVSGSVLLTDGIETEMLLALRRDTPSALAWVDGTLWVGTDGGDLLYRAADGTFVEEPALLPNLGIDSLFSPQPGVLLIGAEGAAGATVLLMIPGVGVLPPPPSQDIYYVSHIGPLLAASCASCHAGGLPAAEAAFALTSPTDDSADHAEVLTKVDLADPAASLLLLKASNDSAGGAHLGGEIFAAGSSQFATIKTWIEQGAEYEAPLTPPPPPPPPPPAPKTWTVDVGPLLQQDCGGCHGASGGFAIGYAAAVARINQTTPESSLLLLKPSMAGGTVHGGGQIPNYAQGGTKYNVLLQWIAGGAQQ